MLHSRGRSKLWAKKSLQVVFDLPRIFFEKVPVASNALERRRSVFRPSTLSNSKQMTSYEPKTFRRPSP